MHTRESLRKQLEAMNIDPKGTLLIHSSMKAIGQVEGGADTVRDVLWRRQVHRRQCGEDGRYYGGVSAEGSEIV